MKKTSKPLPFKDMSFVFTGLFGKSFRSTVSSQIRSGGGTIATKVEKGTTYLVVGKNPGSRLNRALEYDIKVLTASGLRLLIKESRKPGVSTAIRVNVTCNAKDVEREIEDLKKAMESAIPTAGDLRAAIDEVRSRARDIVNDLPYAANLLKPMQPYGFSSSADYATRYIDSLISVQKTCENQLEARYTGPARLIRMLRRFLCKSAEKLHLLENRLLKAVVPEQRTTGAEAQQTPPSPSAQS